MIISQNLAQVIVVSTMEDQPLSEMEQKLHDPDLKEHIQTYDSIEDHDGVQWLRCVMPPNWSNTDKDLSNANSSVLSGTFTLSTPRSQTLSTSSSKTMTGSTFSLETPS